jgi:hypothetical protein
LTLSLLTLILLYPYIGQKSNFFIKGIYDDKILLKNNGTETVNIKVLIIRCNGKVIGVTEPNLRLEPNESLEIEMNLSSIKGCELTFISSDGAWVSSLITGKG